MNKEQQNPGVDSQTARKPYEEVQSELVFTKRRCRELEAENARLVSGLEMLNIIVDFAKKHSR